MTVIPQWFHFFRRCRVPVELVHHPVVAFTITDTKLPVAIFPYSDYSGLASIEGRDHVEDGFMNFLGIHPALGERVGGLAIYSTEWSDSSRVPTYTVTVYGDDHVRPGYRLSVCNRCWGIVLIPPLRDEDQPVVSLTCRCQNHLRVSPANSSYISQRLRELHGTLVPSQD